MFINNYSSFLTANGAAKKRFYGDFFIITKLDFSVSAKNIKWRRNSSSVNSASNPSPVNSIKLAKLAHSTSKPSNNSQYLRSYGRLLCNFVPLFWVVMSVSPVYSSSWPRQGLRICHININHIINKKDEISHILFSKNLDIFCVSESMIIIMMMKFKYLVSLQSAETHLSFITLDYVSILNVTFNIHTERI